MAEENAANIITLLGIYSAYYSHIASVQIFKVHDNCKLYIYGDDV